MVYWLRRLLMAWSIALQGRALACPLLDEILQYRHMAMCHIPYSRKQHDVVMSGECRQKSRYFRIAFELGKILGLELLPPVLPVGMKPLPQPCGGSHPLGPYVIMKFGLRLSPGPKPVDQHPEAARSASRIIIHTLRSDFQHNNFYSKRIAYTT